jgi:hypothetical protein
MISSLLILSFPGFSHPVVSGPLAVDFCFLVGGEAALNVA